MSRQVTLIALFLLVSCCLVASIPGGWSDTEVDDENVQIAARHATRVLSMRFNSKYHHKLAKVLNAEQQVVAGMNYRMDIVVGMTTCKKGKVDFEEAENCDFQEHGGAYKKCIVVVYRNLAGEHKLIRSGCSPTKITDSP